MSRIGKKPVSIPAGVSVAVENGSVTVKGPRGELVLKVPPGMSVRVEDKTVVVERPSESRQHRALHGLTRALVANMVLGVTKGFRKTLEIVGVGYRAEKKGAALALNVGYSHPIHFQPPQGIKIDLPSPTVIVVDGADKQLVGEVAAEIRAFRPPEPYKGKGIRYQGEQVRRKAGKTAAGPGAAAGA
ncbi:MAG: 50S ribosomal protein L6 [Gemmatimonadetes bacterium]|nr:50S ribosomal protein L6 [Gemmatimonadota bacterium]